ncbi:PD-(D/E)XK nuclease family protein [Agrobacterium tumefaciens]|nr:PD-(D/E)XK nuclease family protein [Agrobacterium tumefaciens]
MALRTILVDGPLAMRMRRFQAAEAHALGRQILTIPLMAARLAGGFVVPASEERLLSSIRLALDEGGFEELGKVSDLPGMARAVLKSLNTWWLSGLSLDDQIKSARLADFGLLESRVRKGLPPGALVPPDLVSAAASRVRFGPAIFGPIDIDGIVDIAPVWRPLIAALTRLCPIRWIGTEHSQRNWFDGESVARDPIAVQRPVAEVCADPRCEAMEALRWARALLSGGGIRASEIAITAAQPTVWDDHFLVLAREAGLQLHFTHGIPALATREGQACSALADILLKGLSQERVRRLLRRLPKTPARDAIPDDWVAKLPRGAALTSLENWRYALELGRAHRKDGERAEKGLLDVLSELSKGTDAAESSGLLLLRGNSLALWQQALRQAPARAVDLSLQSLRVADGLDPGNSIVWAPARHLAALPRRHTRMLGLTGRSWPRAEDEDPLLPGHLLERRRLRPVSIAEEDRRHFEIIAEQCETLSLSRAQRSATGTLQAASALWPAESTVLGRNRIPEHAFSESDRLFARPADAGKNPQVRSSRASWRNWQDGEHHTQHDGAIRPNHPAIDVALSEVQSSTSLQRLLCDPLGYVWEYALGWSGVRLETEPLSLDQRAFGELVHGLISGVITDLSTRGSIGNSTGVDITNALERQVGILKHWWPLLRAVPPGLLWLHTLEEARKRAFRGLVDRPVGCNSVSWSEIAFGDAKEGTKGPWFNSLPVQIGQSGLVLRGRLDRLDIEGSTGIASITDYKSGAAPAKASVVVFGQGAELQRVFYALAVRALLPEARRVVSCLTYLANEPAASFEISDEDLDKALSAAAGYTAAAADILRGGLVAPGRPKSFFDQLTLALPADNDAYRKTKQRVFAQANASLDRLWSSV